ncbi:MAG TPA: hypothetical protein VFR86_20190 [Burkholderiaceae bacterium]|nr:hypothetical protein [Burkholderiaceae bacterium]
MMTRCSALASSFAMSSVLAIGLALVPAHDAHAHHVSVSIQAPEFGVRIGAPRRYYPRVVVAPAPVVIESEPTVVYAPPPRVVYAPPPRVVYAPVYVRRYREPCPPDVVYEDDDGRLGEWNGDRNDDRRFRDGYRYRQQRPMKATSIQYR